jgi:AraC-like DNA-binding protein
MMAVLLRAEDVPVESRVDYWRHVSGETIAPLDLQIPGQPDFRSQILTGDMGAVRVTEVVAPAAELSRTPKLIRRSDPELYKIDVVARGHVSIDQGERQTRLGPGDFSLLDLSRPAARWGFTSAIHFSRAFRAVYGLPPGEYRMTNTGGFSS